MGPDSGVHEKPPGSCALGYPGDCVLKGTAGVSRRSCWLAVAAAYPARVGGEASELTSLVFDRSRYDAVQIHTGLPLIGEF